MESHQIKWMYGGAAIMCLAVWRSGVHLSICIFAFVLIGLLIEILDRLTVISMK